MTHARLLLGLVLIAAGCEIRPLDPATGKAVVEETRPAFDARSFVEEHWDARILPTIRRDAVPLATLLAELAADPEAASTAYGHREGSRPYNFIVEGIGRVLAVDTTSRVGVLRIDLPPYDGAADAALQIGPVIRGTALRDALPFITFDQFVNQLEYANVSNAMHARLVDTVLGTLDTATLPARDVRFHGVFARTADPLPLITPVDLRVEASP